MLECFYCMLLNLLEIKKAFGINSSKTIIPKDKNLEFLMGNRVGLSFYDIKLANLAYKCSGSFKISYVALNKDWIFFVTKESCIDPPNCKHDGFVNENCTCVCPEGTTGKFCERFVSLSNYSFRCEFRIK